MKTVIVIPARYESLRFPGKPLVQLKDRQGVSKSLIQRSWETACEVRDIDQIYVATDDERIADCVRGFGGQVIMTSQDCANGTERCAEAIKHLAHTPDLVVNFQGDAPLTPPWFVEALIDAMKNRRDVAMATPVLRCDAETYTHFKDDRAAGRVGGTTAVFARDMTALYFSKEVIPYLPDDKPPEAIPVFHHVGVYAYRPDALERYKGWDAGILETLEGLEQIRFLENGEKILCVEVDGKGRVFWELNNPVDVARIEDVL